MGRTRLLVLVGLIITGCPGPQGPPGPPGMPGTPGTNGTNGANGSNPDGGLVGTTTSCTPAQSFCEGNRLWTCTKSGADATGGQDCTGQSTANNPYICSTTNCPYYFNTGACCRPTKATCNWNITGPTNLTGMLFGTFGPTQGYSCSTPTAIPPSCTPTVGTFYVNISSVHASACPPANDGIYVNIDRTKATVGQTITLPATGVNVFYTTANDTTKSCSAWTGTVTWNSDVPSYKVTLSLTCSEQGKTGVSVSGTIQGDV